MKLSEKTSALKRDGRKALVAFLTAGYPDDATFVDTAVAASKAGCDVIEIGVPFSDPIADGPVIQQSSTAALASGTTLARCLELAGAVSSRVETPLVAMSYINPIMNLGFDRFTDDALKAGVSGVILPDVPLEESEDARAALRAAGMDYVDLVAPTSSDERIERLTRTATGFVYLVSVAGVTGARSALSASLPDFVARVRPHTDVPLYVGFGVSTPEQAADVARVADGAIIGSRLIRLIDEAREHGGSPAEVVGAFLREVRDAVDVAVG